MKRTNESGFTMIELMIASSVLAVILLVATSGLIQVGRTYYKGVVSSKTHEATRNLVRQISSDIRFGGGETVTATSGTAPDYFCIGDGKQYSINKNLEQSIDVGVAMYVENIACGSDTDGVPNGTFESLIPENMRVFDLSVSEVNPRLYTITATLVYGPKDLSPSGFCDVSIRSGGQFCASSTLSTTVLKSVE